MSYQFGCLVLIVFSSCFTTCTVPGKSSTGLSLKEWYDTLPPCPCENPDKNGIKYADGWAKDKGDIGTYHAGATECFRSYPGISTDKGYSCQQCCYDTAGRLITSGSGAGTPDMESACSGESSAGYMMTRIAGLAGHYTKDVLPWKKMGGKDSGWKAYNKMWVPSKGKGCDTNQVSHE